MQPIAPPKRGAPPKPPELRKLPVRIMLTPAQIMAARAIGGGGERDVSKGVQMALANYKP
jgi:hypothetical protein